MLLVDATWVEARDAAKHPPMPRSHHRELSSPCFNGAKVEKSWDRVFFFFNLNFKKCFSVNLDFSFLVSFHDREVPVHLYI